MKEYDFVAIGDTVIDAFIKLKDAEVHCNLNHETCELCVRFGDKVPYESVHVVYAVGNSPNAAVSASRLGLSSALISTIGSDQNGDECLSSLTKNKVSTELMTRDATLPTNYHYVLWYDVDRTILIKHEQYPYVLPEFSTKWIYFSSIGEHSLPFHAEIVAYLKKHPETKLAFQPGTFQMKFGTEALKEVYERTEVFICNVEESQRILKTESRDLKGLLKGIHDLGPKIVCITDGPEGAYMSDGEHAYFMPIYPDPAPPYERTGCGDAFASTFISALHAGLTPLEALVWAPINPMNVVQHIGAQAGLLTREELLAWLAKAPEDYKPKEL
jgi:sugar/nucleoside kinase (ribokinase family)